MEKIYSFNISKFVKRLTPPRWRNKFNLSWYETLLSQINYSQDRFNGYREDALKRLSYNGQVIYLEKMLNDYFDNEARRILIVETESDEVYLYNEAEGQTPKYLYKESETGVTPTYLYNEGEGTNSLSGYGFVVKAPASLSLLEIQMRSYVNRYKIAGVTYTIIFT